MIQVVVHSPKTVTDSKSYTLTPKDTKQKVTLTDSKFLTIKSTEKNVVITLTPVK